MKKFEKLGNKWLEETSFSSSIKDIYNDTYHEIIALGDKAVTPILEQLVFEGDNPGHWFYALRAITHANPVPKLLHGNPCEMSKHWIKWGYDNGYLVKNEALDELKKEIQTKFSKSSRKQN